MKSSVIRVSEGRWLKAQESELRLWHRRNSWYYALMSATIRVFGFDRMKVQDDWNSWWCEKFDSHKTIPNHLRNAIELGCGPHANVQLILQNRTIDHLVCSDRLASQYIRFKRCWLASKYAQGTILIDDHRAEDCPFPDDYFDLVVMINVLGHVQEALACLHSAIRITKPTGHLVIAQDLSNELVHRFIKIFTLSVVCGIASSKTKGGSYAEGKGQTQAAIE